MEFLWLLLVLPSTFLYSTKVCDSLDWPAFPKIRNEFKLVSMDEYTWWKGNHLLTKKIQENRFCLQKMISVLFLGDEKKKVEKNVWQTLARWP